MKPYYQDDAGEIYLGDCREIMQEVAAPDLALTDPPYNAKDIGVYSRQYLSTKQLPEGEYNAWCQAWFAELQAITPNILLTPGIRHLWNYPSAKWIACWHKPGAVSYNGTGGFNIWEPILIYGDVGRFTDDVFTSTPLNHHRGPEREHPCPKNIHLWLWLVAKTEKGCTILDPFLGSGTTALAAKKLNRHFIGIEIEERYCEIAAKRLSQSVMDLSEVT